MDLNEVIKTGDDIQKTFQDKYNKLMSDIDQLGEDIKNIPIKYANNTKQYQEEQRITLEAKLEKKRIAVDKWIKKQTKNIEDWINNRKDDVIKELSEKEQNEKSHISNFSNSFIEK